MQTLYIFGNGFDIAHGIRTPYAAFREFLKENHESGARINSTSQNEKFQIHISMIQ